MSTTAPRVDPRQYGARGDGQAKDTQALQQAIDACAAAGGGEVRLGPGRYLTGPVRLKDRVTLFLEAGARILGSGDRADYAVVERRYSGTTQLTLEALINAEDAEQVAIAGRGVIDGQGWHWWQPITDYFATPKDRRPRLEARCRTPEQVRQSIWHRARLVELVRCRDVLVEGVTLTNSGFWNLHPMFCENVRITGVTLRNPYDAPNADGMDLDSCRGVRVSDCLVDVGDDAICLKSGWDEDGRRIGIPTEDVTVTNCVVRAGHGGVVIGSDMSGGVRNVVVSNCVFHGTDMGIRLKTMRGRGAVVENVLIDNIMMDSVKQPLVMNMHYWKKTEPEPVSERTPRFRSIRIRQVEATGADDPGFFHGLEEMPIQDVALEAVRIRARGPFLCRHVRGLELLNCRFDCEQGPELFLEDVADARIVGFTAGLRHAPGPAVALRRAGRVQLRDCRSASTDGPVFEAEESEAIDAS